MRYGKKRRGHKNAPTRSHHVLEAFLNDTPVEKLFSHSGKEDQAEQVPEQAVGLEIKDNPKYSQYRPQYQASFSQPQLFQGQAFLEDVQRTEEKNGGVDGGQLVGRGKDKPGERRGENKRERDQRKFFGAFFCFNIYFPSGKQAINDDGQKQRQNDPISLVLLQKNIPANGDIHDDAKQKRVGRGIIYEHITSRIPYPQR